MLSNNLSDNRDRVEGCDKVKLMVYIMVTNLEGVDLEAIV